MVLSIDHIELIVRDVDEFVEFYQKLGFEVLLRTAHHGGSAELKLPGENQPVFEIHSVTGEESIGVNHIAFKVANAQEAYDDVVSKGIKPEVIQGILRKGSKKTIERSLRRAVKLKAPKTAAITTATLREQRDDEQ